MKIKILILISALFFTTIVSSLLAFPVHLTIDQESSYDIELTVRKEKEFIHLDFPSYVGEFIFELDHLDWFNFSIKNQTEMDREINSFRLPINTILESITSQKRANSLGRLGDINGAAKGYIGENVAYRIKREYTWFNLLKLDDTLYLNIKFIDGNIFKKGIEQFKDDL